MDENKFDKQAIINYIIHNKSIIEYLEKKGYYPTRRMSNGRASFNCPLPGHDEKVPSFIVYTNSEYENFYCFGCQRSSNIIHLVSYMEKVSFNDALGYLSGGIKINRSTIRDIPISEMTESKFFKHKSLKEYDSFDDQLLEISNLCRCHWEVSGYDDKECDFIEDIYQRVDKDIFNCDFEDIENSVDYIEKILNNRR